MTEEPRLPESPIELATSAPLHGLPELGSLRDLDHAVERLLTYGEAIVEEQERYRDLFLQAPVCSMITDIDGLILEANLAATELFRLPFDELLGTPLSRFIQPQSLAGLEGRLAVSAQSEEAETLELHCAPPAGAPFVATAAVRGRIENETPFLHWVLHDVTERKREEERLAYRAAHDELTGLPNRDMFREMLRLGIARADRHEESVAVISIDLDRFKLVNDSMGHAAGDAVLSEFAARLRAASRAADVVGRLGGDEFVMLLADLPSTEASTQSEPGEVMSRIHRSLEKPFLLSDIEVHMTASMGVGTYPIEASGQRQVMATADRAMYRAKGERPKRGVLLAAASWSTLHPDPPLPPVAQIRGRRGRQRL